MAILTRARSFKRVIPDNEPLPVRTFAVDAITRARSLLDRDVEAVGAAGICAGAFAAHGCGCGVVMVGGGMEGEVR